jgi:hypothetical protein
LAPNEDPRINKYRSQRDQDWSGLRKSKYAQSLKIMRLINYTEDVIAPSKIKFRTVIPTKSDTISKANLKSSN